MPCKPACFLYPALTVCMILVMASANASAEHDRVGQGHRLPSGEGTGLFEGFVYYANPLRTHLKACPRQFPPTLPPHQLAEEILSVLMEGPPDRTLAPTWPPDTVIRAVFIRDDGRAWVDLVLKNDRFTPADTLSEWLAVSSLVNSLTLNIPEIEQVKILLNGNDVPTLGGHVSLHHFIDTQMLIVK